MNAHAPRTDWNDGMVAALTAYDQAGMTCAQIAKEMGVTRNAILGKLWKIRNPQERKARVRGWTKEQIAIAYQGALDSESLSVLRHMLAETGREMSEDSIKNSEHYRLGRTVLARRQAEEVREPSEPAPIREGTYRWRHPEGAMISLPVVRGYTPEASHG